MAVWTNNIAKLVIPTPFPVGDVNLYLISGERLTLIDAGPKTDEAWAALHSELKDLGLTINDIEQIILTHHHPDHVGLLDYFPKEMKVYGHPLNERWLNRTEDFLQENNQFYRKILPEFGLVNIFEKFTHMLTSELRFFCSRSLTGVLTEGDAPIGLNGWKVIETPGHAQSHIGLLRESDGVYIGGDHLLAHISPNPLMEPPLPGETERPKSLLQYNEALDKLKRLPITTFYAGHGKDFTNVNELIDKRRKSQHDRAMKVRGWLVEEPMTVFDICKRLFPKVYQRELPLTISETVAQLDYLLALGEISKYKEGSAFLYSADK
ncbi:MBL fold metallo-hydrolase [Cytobacillus purgationiresistens]|uniref:Glyoxylase-like metal-dependent hydrolase (Beta-lactamase superfamily II) n=1 Tax=Cytobacillus purgationiresistens TaxID=863449 RepID=A0ABU0ADM5_9BACI|nr:MBL fold metallo-hydrolase [Cytobacillus purgationiresistens]MDQ0269351.1 glyoxylase-like metal-dependent hydrolase (beta-lactamase superfamily II) [Cytobacillus purgationiresistens]